MRWMRCIAKAGWQHASLPEARLLPVPTCSHSQSPTAATPPAFSGVLRLDVSKLSMYTSTRPGDGVFPMLTPLYRDAWSATAARCSHRALMRSSTRAGSAISAD